MHNDEDIVTNTIFDYDNHVFKTNCDNRKWFIMLNFAKNKNQFTQSLLECLRIHQLTHLLVEIFTPKEQLLVIGNEANKVKERTFFPGCMFVCFDIEQATQIHNVAQFFMKDRNNLAQVTENEINIMRNEVNKSHQQPTTSINLNVGDNVRIESGSYVGMQGTLLEMNIDQKTASINLNIFNRDLIVKLNLMDIKKE